MQRKSHVNTVFEEHVSSENISTFWYVLLVVNDDETVKQTEYEFIKHLYWFITASVVFTNNITPIDGSCYKLIDSSIQQEIQNIN